MHLRQLLPVVFFILLVFPIGCAAGTTPPERTPTTAAPVATPIIPKQTAASSTPEEVAWAKVVEAAKKEGKLVSYTFTMVGDIGDRVKQAFKSSTGLDVEFIAGPGTTQIERIKAERRGGFQIASTLDTGVTTLMQAKIEGLTEAAGLLPELQSKEAWKENPIVDKEGHILAPSVSLQGPWINTRLVKPGEEPKSWRELLQPRWKGKISLPDPDTDPSLIRMYQQLVKKQGILDDAYFRELGKVAVLQSTNRMNAAGVAKGDVDMTFVSSPINMASFIQEGAPVKVIDMEEGLVASRGTAIVLLSQAPHSNAARVFVNWWFSREGQLIFHKAQGTESARKDVPSFLLTPAQVTPKRVLLESLEDAMDITRMQRERVVKNLISGK